MSSLLGPGYESSDEDTAPNVNTATKIVAAPEVNTEVWSPSIVFFFFFFFNS